MERTNVQGTNNDLTAILELQFKGNINKARIRLISHMVIALCKVRSVTFGKLANAFESSAGPSSSLRRIQRFMAEYVLDGDLVARLIFGLLPERDRLVLSMDRTNWKFGSVDINILMLGVAYKGTAFPLLFSMLPKRGNSNTDGRIALVKRSVRLFGKDRIDCLVADREFVGSRWIGFLNGERIRYHMRIRNNFKVWNPSKGKEAKAFWLFNDPGHGEYRHYDKIVSINGQLCYLSGCKPKNGDFPVIVSFNRPGESHDAYAQRWQIGMCFKAMKSGGFDLEKTHLRDLGRIEKLVLLVMIALVWCYKVGIHPHQNISPIKLKKHGRKAKSIFRTGLDYVSNCLMNPLKNMEINIMEFLSCT